MASVTSLGLHHPTGLQHAVQERFLPADPPHKSYEWINHCDTDDSSQIEDDELLVTSRCVIWSRGGVYRKSYKFDLEKEDVTQALLTTFPSVGPLAARSSRGTERKAPTAAREPAIVVFLKTQAHIFFLSGTSHVIHLPFEIDFAIASPNGLILQRKLRVDNIVAASLKFPKVPPNSFVSSQPATQPWSAKSSQQSTFSIAELGTPKQLPTSTSTLKDMWEPPTLRDDLHWPRLFSLSDPLAELGLVVAQPSVTENRKQRRSSTKLSTLDTAEEILHVSRPGDFSPRPSTQPLLLALTLNRETSMYTVWKFADVADQPAAAYRPRVASGAMSRRRSSFAPGSGTGASSPIMNGQSMFRESLGGKKPAGNARISTQMDEARDFVSSLDSEFDNTTVPRRKSRRVSSMLARADLSANHDRSAFNDLVTGQAHVPNRRGESLGSQHGRSSMGTFGMNGIGAAPSSHLGQGLNSFSEAPVDDLLDELRAGGDFEGFHSMGLDDDEFDSLKQEVVLTKVCSVHDDHSNLRYSSQNKPASTQCKVFTLTAPPSAADDTMGNSIVVCVHDSEEKKLLVMTLYTRTHRAAVVEHNHLESSKAEKTVTVVTLGPIMRAPGIIDACRVDDGSISRILVLTETQDGYGELSLQAPWAILMRVSLPAKFTISNIRNLSHNPTPSARREGGFKRVLSKGPSALQGLKNSKPPGLVDLVDEEGKMHQLQLLLQPRNPHVRKSLDVCRAVLPGLKGGEGLLVCWWNVMQWLRLESTPCVDAEWTALTITLFAMVLGLGNAVRPIKATAASKRKSKAAALRSSSGAQVDTDSWDLMQAEESSNGNSFPSWAECPAWNWLVDGSEFGNGRAQGLTDSIFEHPDQGNTFLQTHVKLAQDFASTALGATVVKECLPTCGNRPTESRKAALRDVFIGLHLLREEQKLDILLSDSLTAGDPTFIPILAQMAKWLGWANWVQYYESEEASLLDADYDRSRPITSAIPQPFECPAVYDWIQVCLSQGINKPFHTISDIVASDGSASLRNEFDEIQWDALTPRTLFFKRLFSTMDLADSSTHFVEALASAGANVLLLETLPEAILAPLQEAVISCQLEPSITWSKDLLSLVGREDVNMLLTPGQRPRQTQLSLLAPSHEAISDVHTICRSITDPESTGSFDGSAEVERQAVTRSIFKDDRRMNEAMHILDTSRPTIARVKSEVTWSESELLEAQKEHAQMLAYRTLAIPSGRGLLHFSARIPLLTQKWQISGFNLSCVMKPDNNTVAADKAAFSEEKVCWAFFHAGVAAGLQISRNAKGIDTSWILFNKPTPDLNNRHAGFLLALGLNGHLKNVAKWVAFKYLTPKHTMTSIGLLLGLAASYIGTMDSLITRLLSVHVTRMLPPGAAELNLSPLTQTTGIMGIGLLYCNTQHRRMSEIMVSEIEHIDLETDEEPLRNEGYRLAAGFALGFINLGKGTDLKGLHDMRLTERLLSLAAGSKKVDLVHVLDKATAGAVMAIALIFMKSENQILARKIDVPDSLLQFDYVRPDIFLLRTVAKNLIMWNKIEASFAWMRDNLPLSYRDRSKLTMVKKLTSEDLPFYDIITGLCFSLALRFAGSSNIFVRDLLVHYLDQMMRICKIEADTYDKKLTRNTVRNCQDLLALAVATVMAGTGDLVVFRRLRSMHGRDDNETPYGSHLAAHLAIGALFLGGGTFTFGTSNLAIASLLVAFYPIFPISVHDNRNHLQAFRHFWVLAAEPRCLVARDIDSNQPVPIPITIYSRTNEKIERHTPCLLPEVDQIATIHTHSPEYWNLVLDLENNPTHIAAFKATQTVYVRRRPAHDTTTSPFHATLQALDDAESSTSHSLEWVFELPVFASLTKAERALVLPPDHGGASDIHAGTKETVVDTRLVLENATLDSGKRDRLLGLKLLFDWADQATAEGKETQWIRREVVERLKTKMWLMSTQ